MTTKKHQEQYHTKNIKISEVLFYYIILQKRQQGRVEFTPPFSTI
jgi:hypothetical protein